MRKIYLWKGGCKNGTPTDIFTVVDDEDYEYLNQWRWRLVKEPVKRGLYYAKRTEHTKHGKPINRSVHRLLLGLTNPKEKGDHIDGNGLNNQKSNLRICTNSQNLSNGFKSAGKCSSRYRGVRFRKGKWHAAIMINCKRMYLGIYEKEEEAAKAYNEVAKKYRGEFARLNIT